MGCVCTVFEFLFRLFAIPCLQTGNLWLQVFDLLCLKTQNHFFQV